MAGRLYSEARNFGSKCAYLSVGHCVQMAVRSGLSRVRAEVTGWSNVGTYLLSGEILIFI